MTRKQEPPLALDMPFDEALERFLRVKPKDVPARKQSPKPKKPPD